mmetsp:Transcript_17667/g.57629  ORF Transcript_17667/g.57629 Transcript_17667/m.57629 type:complete len:412 (+) Transcript_17667:825-2060(+)
MICSAQTSWRRSSFDLTMHDTKFHVGSPPMGLDRRMRSRLSTQGSPKPGTHFFFGAPSGSGDGTTTTSPSSSSGFSGASAAPSTPSDSAASGLPPPPRPGPVIDDSRSIFNPRAGFLRSARTTSARSRDPDATGSDANASPDSDPKSGGGTGEMDRFSGWDAASSSPSRGVSPSASTDSVVADATRRGGGGVRSPGSSPSSSRWGPSSSLPQAASTMDGTEQTRFMADADSAGRPRGVPGETGSPSSGSGATSPNCFASSSASSLSRSEARVCSRSSRATTSSDVSLSEPPTSGDGDAARAGKSAPALGSSTVSSSISVGARALVLKTWPSLGGMRATRPRCNDRAPLSVTTYVALMGECASGVRRGSASSSFLSRAGRLPCSTDRMASATSHMARTKRISRARTSSGGTS